MQSGCEMSSDDDGSTSSWVPQGFLCPVRLHCSDEVVTHQRVLSPPQGVNEMSTHRGINVR